MAEVLAIISSYVAPKDSARVIDSARSCSHLGMLKAEIEAAKRNPETFKKMERVRWLKFQRPMAPVHNQTPKHIITVSDDQSTASCQSGTVRSVRTISWDGNGTATLQVDAPDVVIGLVTRRFHKGKVTMLQSRHAWCYESRGLVYKTGTQVPRNFPKLTKGSVLTVTLSVGTVTFAKDGVGFHTFNLPEDYKNTYERSCNREISLVVSFGRKPGTVTLLEPEVSKDSDEDDSSSD